MDAVTWKAPAAAVETASLWARTRAILADIIIVSVLQAILNGAFGSEHITNAAVDPSTSGGFSAYTSTTTVDGPWLWVVTIAYFVLLEVLFGQTVGKAIVGLKVTDLAGGPIGWRPALIRNVLRVIDWFPGFYLLGALVARFSRRRQRLGDHLAGTIVVPSRVATGPLLTREQRRQRIALVLAITAIFIAGCATFAYYGRAPIALENTARIGQLSGGRVTNFHHGAAQWHGGSVTIPVSYTRASSGTPCSGQVTLDWSGFLGGWHVSSEETNCR